MNDMHGKFKQNVLLAARMHVYNCTNLFRIRTAVLCRTAR